MIQTEFREHLTNKILPFWEKLKDDEFGGYYGYMDEDLNLTCLYAEEPFCLDHLEALVHHRSRVDGDLRTHVPCGMTQGIGLRYVGNLFHRLQAERTTGGCEQNLLDGILILAYQTLEDGRVLTVDR